MEKSGFQDSHWAANCFLISGVAPLGSEAGDVETSTVKSVDFSNCAFMNGVMARQLWLFWPSMMRSLMGAA